MKSETKGVTAANEWESFWSLMKRSGKLALPTSVEPIDQFFLEVIDQLSETPKTMLDLGAGNGALSQLLMTDRRDDRQLIVLDASLDALKMNIANNDVMPVKALLEELPFKDSSIDIVVSQFGVEYARTSIWDQIARILKRNGSLCLSLHSKRGEIFLESERNYGMLGLISDSDFYKQLVQLNIEPKTDSERRLEAVLVQLVSSGRALREHLVKGSMPDQLITQYVKVCEQCLIDDWRNRSSDIVEWLKAAQTELDAFFDRLQSMMEAAMSQDDFFALQDALMDLGFSINQAGDIRLSSQEVLAFKLYARKN